MEDPNLTIMMMRMLERILAVSVGAIAIYLGYRLFVLLPTQTDSAGKIELPGYSVVLSKVGPGIFFAAFGSIVLYLSLANPISVGENFLGGTSLEPVARETPSGPKRTATPQEHDRVKRSLQMLTCMERVVVTSRVGIHGDEVEEAVRDAKIALLESVWNTESWGDLEAFRHWAATREGVVPTPLQEFYLSELPGCPD